jgi:hypothetical protein
MCTGGGMSTPAIIQGNRRRLLAPEDTILHQLHIWLYHNHRLQLQRHQSLQKTPRLHRHRIPVTAMPKPPTSIPLAPISPAAPLQSQHENRKRVGQKEKQPTILARNLSGDNWLWELSGLLLAVGLVCAIVAILAKYNNNPPPQWKQGITVNLPLGY